MNTNPSLWRIETSERSSGSRAMAVQPSLAELTSPGRLYLGIVIGGGAAALLLSFPHAAPPPVLFTLMALFACLTSAWKVNLPIPVSNGSTLSVSYAANLMSLLLLGPQNAVLIATAGALTQCTYRVRQRYPVYKTIFSTAGAALTMATTGVVYQALGGPMAPFESAGLARPLVGAIATYFFVNTGLVARAIAFSTDRSFLEVWRTEFLWSGASFMVAGTAGAVAAIVVDRGEQWKAILLIAPIYLTYRTYEVFVGRLEDQKRYTAAMRSLHEETVAALQQARHAERALATEKERLTSALGEMRRLEGVREQLLEREQTARAAAEHANIAKDQFLAVVSHELRTPLSAILGWAELLRRGKVMDAQRDRALQTIHESAKRQAQLIDDLLDVSRIMSGKLRLDRKRVDPATIVDAAVRVVQPAAEAKGVRLIVEVDRAFGMVYADAERLQQVAWNLLSNAVKFTPAAGTVHVALQQGERGIELLVRDTGEGIEPALLPWIFEAFRQGDGSTTRVHRGLGLGLAIVKSLVEAHGGTVTARSDGIGQGATFVVSLPRGAAGFRVEPTLDPKSDQAESLGGTLVLIVDDDTACREVVAAHLLAHEASVLTAASVRDAFRLLEAQHVDVLLADIGMPEEDGYALIRRIRGSSSASLAALPAAALTAFSRVEDRQLALDAGFQLHLTKPVDAASLVHAVASLADLQRDHRYHES